MNTARPPMKADRPSPLPLFEAPAYAVPRPPAPISIRLDGNEGEGPSQSIVSAIQELSSEDLRSYPPTAQLESQIAAKYELAAEQVLVTAGGDEAIQRVLRVFLGPGRNLILPTPTFEMIGRYASWTGCSIKEVPWLSPEFPVEEIIEATDSESAVIAVVSPNNPTGFVATPDELQRLALAAPQSLIMVDCAYGEFADQDLMQEALTLPNVVVLRTFSKAMGLAGLRTGFALGPAKLIGPLRGAGLPYPISAPALAAATASLQLESESRGFIKRVREEREKLRAGILEIGMRCEPSQGNFVFARTQNALDGRWWRDALAGMGIGIRAWPTKPKLSDAIRITCPGSEAQFKALEKALQTLALPEAICFDVDGVLADVSRSYRRAIAETVASYGAQTNAAEIDAIKSEGDANNDWLLTQKILARRGIESDFNEVKARFEELYQGKDGNPGLWAAERFIGERQALLELSEKLPLAMVTGRPRKDAERFIKQFELEGLFSAVITMEDAPAKPSPEPVLLAMETLGVERVWMLGDTPDDIEAARGAGALPIGILAPGSEREKQSQILLEKGAAFVWPSWMKIKENLKCML